MLRKCEILRQVAKKDAMICLLSAIFVLIETLEVKSHKVMVCGFTSMLEMSYVEKEDKIIRIINHVHECLNQVAK